jgi:Uma2 family endonuclease
MSGNDEMMPAGSGIKLTYDDFLLFPDDGQRHELIDGEHYVTPAPNISHQAILGNLHYLIRSYLEINPLGRVFFAPLDVIFSSVDVVEPDLLYVSKARGTILQEHGAMGPPDLVVEIASKSTRTRDQTIKLRLYERKNVLEYWTIDRKSAEVVVYRRTGDAFGSAVEFALGRGDELTTPLFPGLELRLADIFKR